MSYHGSPLDSQRNAITRALRRAYKADKIAAWNAKRAKHIQDPESYEQAIADNKRLGLVPRRMTKEQRDLRFLSNHHRWKKPVTLAGMPEKQIDERTLAEDRMIEAIRKSVEMLSFHLEALCHIPNPTVTYKNRVNQQYLVDIVRQLARSVRPEIPVRFNDIEPARMALTHICIDCGGPASIPSKSGRWYCESCVP